MNNFIDIIVPVFNSEKYIEDTLNSILQQDYDKYKVYIPYKKKYINMNNSIYLPYEYWL